MLDEITGPVRGQKIPPRTGPAYFFRKDGRVGFSYAGKIIPLEYQNIAREMCCGYASNNPSIDGHRAHFMAERDGIWYYVVLEFGQSVIDSIISPSSSN